MGDAVRVKPAVTSERGGRPVLLGDRPALPAFETWKF